MGFAGLQYSNWVSDQDYANDDNANGSVQFDNFLIHVYRCHYTIYTQHLCTAVQNELAIASALAGVKH